MSILGKKRPTKNNTRKVRKKAIPERSISDVPQGSSELERSKRQAFESNVKKNSLAHERREVMR